MIKPDNTTKCQWLAVSITLAVIASAFLIPAYAQTNTVALMLQQTPLQGGEINIGQGIHKFEPNTEVTLVAVPKPGYQFVYWLGDVSEPTANRTVTYLDAPKIIIAVFDRAEYDSLLGRERRSSGAPIGGIRGRAPGFRSGGGGGSGGRRPRKFRWPTPPEEEEEEPEEGDLPVPQEGGDDFPVPAPVPEPATCLLFSIGGLLICIRRRSKKAAD